MKATRLPRCHSGGMLLSSLLFSSVHRAEQFFHRRSHADSALIASGTGLHDLIEFFSWHGEEPRGWVDANLDGCGPEGRAELRAFIIQIRVLENHQNGKDTHVRGVQVFAKDDEDVGGGFGWEKTSKGTRVKSKARDADDEEDEQEELEMDPSWPSYMDDPIIR